VRSRSGHALGFLIVALMLQVPAQAPVALLVEYWLLVLLAVRTRRRASETSRPVSSGLLALLSVLGTLAAIELVLSVRPPLAPKGLVLQQSGVGLKPVPGVTNSLGFRDVERSPTKPKGVYRIVALGDSFTFGAVPRDQGYTAQLERLLIDRSRRSVEVVNLGIPGIGPAGYWWMLRQVALDYDPDLILVGFFVGNDFLESVGRAEDDDPVADRYVARPVRWWWRVSMREWVLARYLRNLWQLSRMRWSSSTLIGASEQPMEATAFLQIEYERAQILRRDSAEARTRFRSAARILQAMDRFCRQRKLPLVVAVFPDEFQVNSSLRQSVLADHVERETSYDLTVAQRAVRYALQDTKAQRIDLLPAFLREGQARELYLARNTHFNAAGNRLAADQVAAALQPFLR